MEKCLKKTYSTTMLPIVVINLVKKRTKSRTLSPKNVDNHVVIKI
jgi:hypothetical protein